MAMLNYQMVRIIYPDGWCWGFPWFPFFFQTKTHEGLVSRCWLHLKVMFLVLLHSYVRIGVETWFMKLAGGRSFYYRLWCCDISCHIIHMMCIYIYLLILTYHESLWNMHIYFVILRIVYIIYIYIYFGMFWYSLIYFDVFRYMLIYYDISYYDISWYIMHYIFCYIMLQYAMIHYDF